MLSSDSAAAMAGSLSMPAPVACARADVERQRQRVVADVGRIVAAGAVADEGLRAADSRVVVESAHIADLHGRGVEQCLAGGDRTPCFGALAAAIAAAGVSPLAKQRHRGCGERLAARVGAERVVDPRVVVLVRQVERAAERVMPGE